MGASCANDVISASIVAQHDEAIHETCGGAGISAPSDHIIRGKYGRASMRMTALVAVMGATLAVMSAPAHAAWKSYISHPLGFAFAAPGDLKVEKGSYRGDVSGPREIIAYSFVDDDIEYKAVVIDMTDKANDAANLLGEVAYLFQNGKKLLMDTFGRVDRQYGRKLTVDLPNNAGRATAAFYFI